MDKCNRTDCPMRNGVFSDECNIEDCPYRKTEKIDDWETASKFLGMIFGISEDKRKEWTEQAKRDYYARKEDEGK